jgi:hypothetical protein
LTIVFHQLGGYKENDLKSTIIKSNRCPKYGIGIQKKAKRALSTNIAVSRSRCLHIDDKYGIDVDELYNQIYWIAS